MWALYPWFEEHGSRYVHPEDLEQLRELIPYGKVFKVKGEEEGFQVIAYGEAEFRVKPALLREVPEPRFQIGDQVCIKGERGRGKVIALLWHDSTHRPFFHLEVDGRRKGRRYWEEELEAKRKS